MPRITLTEARVKALRPRRIAYDKRHPIPLTAWGRPETLYLGADGSFTGTTGDGGTAGRRWWWSRGNLNLRFQGEDATVLIGWRDLLDRLQQAEQ